MNKVLLATAGNFNQVHIKDGQTGATIRELPYPDGNVTALAFSGTSPLPRNDPLHLGVADFLGSVTVFDVSNPDTASTKYLPQVAHAGPVSALGFEPNQTSFVFSASEDGTLKTWRPELTNASPTSVQVSLLDALPRDLTRSVPEGANKPPSFVPFQGQFTAKVFRNWSEHCYISIFDAVYYPPQDLFITADALGRLRFWDHRTEEVLLQIIPHRSNRALKCLELSQDYSILVAANFDGMVFVYDVKDVLLERRPARPAIFMASLTSYVTRVRLSLTNAQLVCATKTDGIRVFQMGDVLLYRVPQATIDHLQHESATPHQELRSRGPCVWDAAFYGSGHVLTATDAKEIVMYNFHNLLQSYTWADLTWPVQVMAVREVEQTVSLPGSGLVPS